MTVSTRRSPRRILRAGAMGSLFAATVLLAVPPHAAHGGEGGVAADRQRVITENCTVTTWTTTESAGRLPALMRTAQRVAGVRVVPATPGSDGRVRWDLRIGMVPSLEGGYATYVDTVPSGRPTVPSAGKTTSRIAISFSRAVFGSVSRSVADAQIVKELVEALRTLGPKQCDYRLPPDPRAPQAPQFTVTVENGVPVVRWVPQASVTRVSVSFTVPGNPTSYSVWSEDLSEPALALGNARDEWPAGTPLSLVVTVSNDYGVTHSAPQQVIWPG